VPSYKTRNRYLWQILLKRLHAEDQWRGKRPVVISKSTPKKIGFYIFRWYVLNRLSSNNARLVFLQIGDFVAVSPIRNLYDQVRVVDDGWVLGKFLIRDYMLQELF